MADWYEQLRRILITVGSATGRAGAVVFDRFASAVVLNGVATVTIGAPTITATFATTNATPVDWTIPLASDKLTVVAYRVVGRVAGSADGTAIIREGSKAVSRDDSSFCLTLKPGGGGSETFGELGDTGILYANDASSMALANIAWQSTSTSGLVIRLTGVAATSIDWTCEAWVREY